MESECYNPEVKLLTISLSKDLHGWWSQRNLAAPYWRFYWNDSRGASITYRGREIALGPERIFLIAPETPFSAAAPGHARQLFIHFLAGPPFSNMEPGVMEFPFSSQALREDVKAAFELLAVDPCENRRSSLIALRIVLRALEFIPPKMLKNRRVDPRVAAAMLSLSPNNGHQRTNEELARSAGMSRNAFLRLFKREAGVSPQLYSRTRRIEEACMLLHYSKLDIKGVAERTGFCDRYHFSRIFKTLRGVSPAEFRRGGFLSAREDAREEPE
jgi:AraC-like DNA-binding protein